MTEGAILDCVECGNEIFWDGPEPCVCGKCKELETLRAENDALKSEVEHWIKKEDRLREALEKIAKSREWPQTPDSHSAVAWELARIAHEALEGR